MSGGGISLEVVEMAPDDLLDVDVGQEEPYRSCRREERGEGGSMGNGLDLVEGPVTAELGNPQLRKKVDISEAPLSKLAISEH
eukprot:g25163.t1